MEIRFLSTEFDGAVAELYGLSLPWAPMEVEIVSGGIATFSTDVNPFAIRIRDGGDTLLRTGLQDYSIGTVEPNGDFSVHFITMRITDPADTVIPLSTLEAEISLPITDGGMTVSSLNLATVGGNVRATGSGSYSAGILGRIPFDYTYDFDLDPVTGALSNRIIDVDSISTSIVGTAGGLLGWITNAIIGLISALFNGRISDQIEETVQSQVDSAVEQAFFDAGAPDSSMATLLNVTESGNSVTIDPLVCVPLSAIDCASLLTGGSVKIRSPKQLRKLRLMRDKVLRNHPQGDAYIELFKRHSPELIRLLARNPRLLKIADELVKRGLNEFDEDNPGKGMLSAETAQLAERMMQRVAREASPQLRRSIERTLPEVKQFVGKPVSRVLDDNVAEMKKRLKAGGRG
jgi:hypothetical protein